MLAVAEQKILSSLLLLEQLLDVKHQIILLQVLSALVAHPEIVKQVSKNRFKNRFLKSLQFIPLGGVLYTCDLFCNSPDPIVRRDAASLLAKAISDRLSGPRVRIAVSLSTFYFFSYLLFLVIKNPSFYIR